MSFQRNRKDQDSMLFRSLTIQGIVVGVFWIVIAFFCYLIFYDSNYGQLLQNNSIGIFNAVKVIITFLLFFLCVFLYGVLLSVPSAILKIYLYMKLKKRSLRGQKPVILIFLTRYIPSLFLVAVNIGMFLFNFSVFPNAMLEDFSKNSFLYRISVKLHHRIFQGPLDKTWKAFAPSGHSFEGRKFVFLVPKSIFDAKIKKNAALLKTLKNHGEYITVDQGLSTTMDTLIQGNALHESWMYLPGKNYGEGLKLSAKPYTSLVSSGTAEYLSAMNLKADFENKISPHYFSVFLNRFAISQIAFHILFKVGFFSLFHREWQVSKFLSFDQSILYHFSQKIQKNIKNYQTFFYIFPMEIQENKLLIKNIPSLDQSDYPHVLVRMVEKISKLDAQILVLPYGKSAFQFTLQKENYLSNFKNNNVGFLANFLQNPIKKTLNDDIRCFECTSMDPQRESGVFEELASGGNRSQHVFFLNQGLRFHIVCQYLPSGQLYSFGLTHNNSQMKHFVGDLNSYFSIDNSLQFKLDSERMVKFLNIETYHENQRKSVGENEKKSIFLSMKESLLKSIYRVENFYLENFLKI